MKLIYADALCEYWHISEKCEECHWNNRDCSRPPYYSLHDICEAIDEVPAIDAIPVDWIIKWSNMRYRETQMDVSIVDVLEAWQKEQEAR